MIICAVYKIVHYVVVCIRLNIYILHICLFFMCCIIYLLAVLMSVWCMSCMMYVVFCFVGLHLLFVILDAYAWWKIYLQIIKIACHLLVIMKNIFCMKTIFHPHCEVDVKCNIYVFMVFMGLQKVTCSTSLHAHFTKIRWSCEWHVKHTWSIDEGVHKL